MGSSGSGANFSGVGRSGSRGDRFDRDSDGIGFGENRFGLSISNTGASIGAAIPLGGGDRGSASRNSDSHSVRVGWPVTGGHSNGPGLSVTRPFDGGRPPGGHYTGANALTSHRSSHGLASALAGQDSHRLPTSFTKKETENLGRALTERMKRGAERDAEPAKSTFAERFAGRKSTEAGRKDILPNSLARTATAGNPGAAGGPSALRTPPAIGNSIESRRFDIPLSAEQLIPNEVVVGLPSDMSAQAVGAMAHKHGLVRLESNRIASTGTTLHRLRSADQRSVADIVRAMQAEGEVSSAQPNYRFAQNNPNHRFALAQQTEVAGRAAPGFVAQYALTKLHLAQAHGVATGQRVLVAVIDSGVDGQHPELAGAIAGRFDALRSNDEADGHGTAVAGAIVAHGRLLGVAPAAQLLAIRAFGRNGIGSESTTWNILRSLDWAIAHNARVINMSFAGPEDPQIARTLAAARQKGVVLIAAVGNTGSKSMPLYPAADRNVIAVTATDADDRVMTQAVRGPHVALAAPGVDVLLPAPGGRYQVASGTSFAAAHVAGIAALLIERNPSLTPDAVRSILVSTATDLGPKGRDDQYGAGLADAYRAVSSFQPAIARGVPSNVTAAR